MTWSSIIPGLLAALPDVISLIRSIMGHVEAAQERGVGRQEAIAEALTIASEELKLATQAVYDADSAHATHPNDDGGFDGEFQRKD
jgi:hypothetical protein